MSDETKALPEAFAQELLRRSLPFDSGTLSDAGIGAASSALFEALDQEMPSPRRGEVWLIDFGFVGKTRPALVVSLRRQSRSHHSCAAHDHIARLTL